MIQLFFSATQYAAATVTAAIRAGQFGPREGVRRILVVSNTAAIPEVGTPLDRMAGFEKLRPEFDEVRSWNEFISPHHPAGWSPRGQDTLLWEKAVRLAWNLGDEPVEIACESIQANPSRAVADIFADSPIHVYADGLMSYGPTRNRIPHGMSSRIKRVLHLDLVPGLRPMLLAEYGVEPEAVPNEAIVDVLAQIGESGAGILAERLPADNPPTAVLLGQYLSAIDLITQDEEEQLHIRFLRAAARAGHQDVLFKPHPSAPAVFNESLEAVADELGVRLTVLNEPVLAETVFAFLKPKLVIGCFSTALMTAAAFYGIPVARVGTDLLLERITPYENSNRIPLTIIDAALPDAEHAELGSQLELTGMAEGLAPLVRSVGYCMQSRKHHGSRDEVAAWLTANLDRYQRYFKRRRLTSLRLPGGSPVRAEALRRHPAVRKAVRQLRQTTRK
ncbi:MULTISPECIES: alpha-2,8-polysialyltransferase family protein [unclassified Streptomyces]|uniref:alpha-2,8-polysialyltransferase family protein n=1 Tax=unclassified Streptomyces TaxID=2593676 RepID=UPI0023669C0D|nr:MULTISPECIES: alpha-2,8-polysialyltransferase family protein [unclassified Streptomyces]MDF3144400.1 alpha-2,8-polysialyltransferase family protein [Streptomyces sp. T21Q-yed]WDF40774.1 alpha-2,8-polysialyltransferase family protein [Streptomyces sp. T12]